MVSTMRYSEKSPKTQRFTALWRLVMLMLVVWLGVGEVGQAHASTSENISANPHTSDIVPLKASLAQDDDGFKLAADFRLNFTPALEEAVNRGVVLYFIVDFELKQSRWLWFDAPISAKTRQTQLSYHALTRQYRLSSGGLHQSFASLSSALGTLTRLRRWLVLTKNDVAEGKTYHAAVRMRFDLSAMPKTFQVSAISNKDWHLSADWLRWDFSPPAVSITEPTDSPADSEETDAKESAGKEIKAQNLPVSLHSESP